MFTDKNSIITEQMNKDIKEYKGMKFSIGLSIKFYHDDLKVALQIFGQKFYKNTKKSSDNNRN